MRRAALFLLLILPVTAASLQDKIEKSIKSKLGKPYVWGADGLKTYDCSGFVWRVYRDAGVLFKRTTARKLYYAASSANNRAKTQLGTLVFFNDLEHVGIVRNKEEFFHASSSHGTTRDTFAPYWNSKIYGYRTLKP
jgi:peptidoglycan endopeptidase LytE